MTDLKSRARVVVIGSGICGSSIAYHLTQLGEHDVVVLERGPLIQGTTSHAPGLVGQLRSDRSLTQMLMYSVQLYSELELDGEKGYWGVGSLRAASTPERLDELKSQHGFAQAVGLEAELIGADEVARRFPLVDASRVEGALFLPGDGSANAMTLVRALQERARQGGVEFFDHCVVESIDTSAGAVTAIETSKGRIETEIVVVAAGIWSPQLGRLVGVGIPLVPMQHQYVRTAPLAELSGLRLPNLRDPDHSTYLRQDGESLVIGGYESNPAPFSVDAIPDRANPTVQEFDVERFESLRRGSAVMTPCIAGADLVDCVNGLESFTADGEFILGEAPNVKGFWVACGFCAHGVSGAGGVGRVMAEWIVSGEPSWDLWHMDVRRFSRHAAGSDYVRRRAMEIYGNYYALAHPHRERESERPLRTSPAYDRVKRLGAVFGEKAGWERANWFQPNASGDRHTPTRWRPRSFAAEHWSEAIATEHAVTRERVALFDVSSFSKFELSGPRSLESLERLCANRIDQPVGSVIYTQMCNASGGIECDLTVTRLEADRFRVVTGTAFGVHDGAWIRRHLPADGSVVLRDVSGTYAVYGVWGPRARDLMESLSDDDFSDAGFPYLTAASVTLDSVPVEASRVTYVGELGWELYCTAEFALRLWDTLWRKGQEFDAVAAGYRAIDSLRLEKGYRYWGADITSKDTPYEAGLGFAVKLDKGDFIGREALQSAKARGLERRLRCLTIDDPRATVIGGEPCFQGGEVIGYVTSGGYGYTVEKSIAFAYLPAAIKRGALLELELFSERFEARVEREPLFDPKGEKIRA